MSQTVQFRSALVTALFGAVLSTGCPGANVEDAGPGDNVEEVITAVELTFTPAGAGDPINALWEDPENDGDPIIDAIVLADGETYVLDIRFLNQLADPVENITEEIEAENDEHQIFIYGSAVEGPASDAGASTVVTHAYDDEDGDQLPVGLENTVTATTTGTGTLSVMLRHLPVQDGTALKVDRLAADFAAGGSDAIDGDVDADVDFDLTVE